jgi:hypothetical protein
MASSTLKWHSLKVPFSIKEQSSLIAIWLMNACSTSFHFL